MDAHAQADKLCPGIESLLHVIVIGAGLSGLILANELLRIRDSTVRVTLIESRPRVGGRLLSLPGNLELGASWYWPHHESVRRLVHDMGLHPFSDEAIGGNRVEGGVQQFATKLWERLSSNLHASLRLSTSAKSIQRTKDGVHVTLAGGDFINGHVVAVCVPPRLVLNSICFHPPISPVLLHDLQGVTTWMGSTTKVAVVSSAKFWDIVNLPFRRQKEDVIFEWHDASSRTGSDHSIHALLGFGGPSVTEEQVVSQLRRFYGNDCPASLSVTILDWSKERWTSSSTNDGVGHHPSTTDDVRQPVWNGSLMFGSTEMADREAGYMEGAVLRGKQLAALISKQMYDGRAHGQNHAILKRS